MRPDHDAPNAPGVIARALDGLLEASVVGSFTSFGIRVRSRLDHWHGPPERALADRHVVVTGATSGIGEALARRSVDLGATVHVVGRDPDRLATLAGELRSAAGSGRERVVDHHADLARLDDVRALAARIVERAPCVDVLAHVAGALVHEETTTDDGIELTAQVHVVAPFLLTALLLPSLRASPDARVLTMSSGGMYTQRLDVDELLHPTGPFDGTRAYARAKRAQVVLNEQWASRFSHDGIGFHALHPGWVDTPGLTTGMPSFARRLRPVLRTPEQGADTAAWLAWSPGLQPPGGAFWHDRRPRRTVALPGTATPAGEAERLWDEVSGLAGVAPTPGSDER